MTRRITGTRYLISKQHLISMQRTKSFPGVLVSCVSACAVSRCEAKNKHLDPKGLWRINVCLIDLDWVDDKP
jgi:hypothetical protein